jgi:pimeloyl-ACP methyl ester carboxylesterase
VLLLLGDGSQVGVRELPGDGPWTFLLLQRHPEDDDVAGLLTRFGRVVIPDLRGRPGWGEPPDGPRFLDLVDDLDQVRTRAGLGRPVLVGLGALAPVAARAATDQPWAWRALLLAPAPTDLGYLDLPFVAVDAAQEGPALVAAAARLLDQLGGGPGWSGIAPNAPPR